MRRLMLHESLKNFAREVEARVRLRALLEERHDPKRLLIVLERLAEFLHALSHRIFSRMSERRVAEIVCKRDCFGEVLVESKRPRDVTTDLRNF